MKKILLAQLGVLAVIAALSAIFSGVAGSVSALAGGLSYLIPSAIAVLILRFFKNDARLQAKAFVFGEVLKVMLSLVLMLVVFALWHNSLVFIPFLAGLLGVSHLVFLVLLRVKDYGR